MKQALWVFLGYVLLLPTTQAASFDCGIASSNIEKVICGDAELSKSDEDLAAAYAKALKETSDPAAIKRQQREWLADVRRRCADATCLRLAYSARIAQLASGRKPQEITVGDVQQQNGISYRRLSALNGAVRSMELIGEGDKFAAINQKFLDGLRGAIDDSFFCQANLDKMTSANGMKKQDSAYAYRTSIVSVTGRWITLSEGGGGNCGRNHPTNGGTIYTVDAGSGEKLELSAWLKGEKKYGYLYTPPEKLNDLIIRQAIRQSKKSHPRGDEEDRACLHILGSNEDGYTLSLGKKGLVFSTDLSHSVAACNEDVEIPYEKLQPFLTKEGKNAGKVFVNTEPGPEAKTEATPQRETKE